MSHLASILNISTIWMNDLCVFHVVAFCLSILIVFFFVIIGWVMHCPNYCIVIVIHETSTASTSQVINNKCLDRMYASYSNCLSTTWWTFLMLFHHTQSALVCEYTKWQCAEENDVCMITYIYVVLSFLKTWRKHQLLFILQ